MTIRKNIIYITVVILIGTAVVFLISDVIRKKDTILPSANNMENIIDIDKNNIIDKRNDIRRE